MTIEMECLKLLSADEGLALQACEYYRRNRNFLSAYEPERPETFYTVEYQRDILRREAEAAREKESYRFYINIRERPEQITGIIGLNNVIWGPFCSAFLGYKMDRLYINRGYMTAAVVALTNYAFAELNLHRIEANVMPGNSASIRVLEKCGFENEGIASQYLYINGAWEDHIHMVKINSGWKPPA